MSSKGTRRPRAAKDAAEDTEAPAKTEDAKPAKRAKASSNNIGLPSWKGPYICYCGVDAAGKSTGEIIDFPQFCLCTDVSGRAACAHCKEKIAKGCARVGVQSRRFNNSVFAKCKWYHPACFAENVEGFVSVQQIEMWDSAGAEVRKEIVDHAPKGVDVEGKKKESHAHTAECLDCREKGTHPSIEASKKKGKTDAEEEEEEAPAKEEDDDADAAEDEEEEEKKPAAKKGKAKKEEKKPAAEKKKGKKAAAAEPESDEEAAADGAEDEDGDTDMKAADGGLPAWKGAFICYCGTTDSGHSVREEKVAFPQVCICTDVSGRASCKECKKPIMRGSARIGVQTGKFSHTGQGSCGWFHPGCFARNPPTKFQHINQIEQFELAPDDVKKEISRNLPPAASAPSKSAPGPRDHSATCKEARAKGAHRVTLARRENVKAAAKKE